MARVKERVRGVTLAEFHRYLDKSARGLKACYKEIEEIQFQFNDIFKRELAAWQESFTRCFPLLGAQRKNLPEAFGRQVDQVEAEERERIRKEIADLAKKVTDGRVELDRLLGAAQAAGEELRKANPELDRREEALKAQLKALEDQFVQAYEEQEALERGLFGGVVNLGKIGRLKKAQKQAKKEQARILQLLREVRQEWVKKVDEAGETQAKLREQWQRLSIEVSEAQTRREHMEKNLDALVEQAALQRVLEEMKEVPPGVEGELGEALKDLVARNKVRWGYEEGLKAVAEALGLLKGVGEGLLRFQKSVQTVLQEQRRYSLAEIEVRLPPSAVAVNQIWEALRAKILDEKYMGKHPLEFSQVVDRHVKERLTDEKIQAFFEEMGEALSAATSKWE
mgnify:CR=1 FL=1